MSEKEFFLMQGDTLLGTLESYDFNFPWIYCHFKAEPIFEHIRPLFEAELKAIEMDDTTGVEDWDSLYEDILALKLRIVDKNDVSYPPRREGYEDFPPLLHVKDDEAWFR